MFYIGPTQLYPMEWSGFHIRSSLFPLLSLFLHVSRVSAFAEAPERCQGVPGLLVDETPLPPPSAVSTVLLQRGYTLEMHSTAEAATPSLKMAGALHDILGKPSVWEALEAKVAETSSSLWEEAVQQPKSEPADGKPTTRNVEVAAYPNVSAHRHHGDFHAQNLSFWRLFQRRVIIHGRATFGNNNIYLALGITAAVVGVLIITTFIMVRGRTEPEAEEQLWCRKPVTVDALSNACRLLEGSDQIPQAAEEDLVASDKSFNVYLTPDLRVTSSNFLTVLVPSISLLKPKGTLPVRDLLRREYLQVSASLQHVKDKHGHQSAKVKFSLCKPGWREKAHFMLGKDSREYDIFQTNCPERFAWVAPGTVSQQVCHFVLNTRLDTQIRFVGNFSPKFHRANVSDECGRLLASTEPYLEDNGHGVKIPSPTGYYILRVTSGMDAGLVLCALFCIERMEGQ